MATCEKCHRAFHIFCLRPALDDVPDDDWLCPVCSVSFHPNLLMNVGLCLGVNVIG